MNEQAWNNFFICPLMQPFIYNIVLFDKGEQISITFLKRRDLNRDLYYFVTVVRDEEKKWFRLRRKSLHGTWYIDDRWVAPWVLQLEKSIVAVIEMNPHLQSWEEQE